MTTTDHLSAAREALSRMTPGEWRTDDGDIYVPDFDAWILCQAVACVDLPQATCDANAAGIVLAVKAARFWASEDAVENVVEKLAHELFGGSYYPVLPSKQRYRNAARAILALIAQAGMSE
jgi:hypothetical protein